MLQERSGALGSTAPRCQNRNVDFVLHPAEVRVLGSLLEKEITTPEYYPLTLNALVNACNQKSNRDPVVSYDEDTVSRAFENLRAKGFTTIITGGSNRVPKFAQRLSERLNLGRGELALMCELMLRGPQTVGELRGRASRMYDFSDLEQVEACLNGLAAREPDPLTVRLPHMAGTKEPRWAHLLSGEPETSAPAQADARQAPGRDPDRLALLETEVSALRSEVHDLKRQIEDFRRQFE
jgi:uncharacterized protein